MELVQYLSFRKQCVDLNQFWDNGCPAEPLAQNRFSEGVERVGRIMTMRARGAHAGLWKQKLIS
jgi:hypothetical protein